MASFSSGVSVASLTRWLALVLCSVASLSSGVSVAFALVSACQAHVHVCLPLIIIIIMGATCTLSGPHVYTVGPTNGPLVCVLHPTGVALFFLEVCGYSWNHF